MSSAAVKVISTPIEDPVLRALARAPMGPADPPEVVEAIRQGKARGQFVSGAEVSAEIERRRNACKKTGE